VICQTFVIGPNCNGIATDSAERTDYLPMSGVGLNPTST
jgi:hypothetical protein